MRALILLLPLAVAFAGDTPPLEEVTKQWASDSAEERDFASRVVALHIRRELAPLIAALKSEDPEVRRRARDSLESLLPPRPPEPPQPEQMPQWGAARGVIINRGVGGNGQQLRFVLNAQGQMVLVQDGGEAQRLKEKGITGRPFSDPVARTQLGLAEGRGYAVLSVERRSPAAHLGIQVNDILLSIDGRPVMQDDDVLKGLGARSPEIRLLRRGKLVTLGAKDKENEKEADPKAK